MINEYESGRAIPNNQIMGKLERALGKFILKFQYVFLFFKFVLLVCLAIFVVSLKFSFILSSANISKLDAGSEFHVSKWVIMMWKHSLYKVSISYCQKIALNTTLWQLKWRHCMRKTSQTLKEHLLESGVKTELNYIINFLLAQVLNFVGRIRAQPLLLLLPAWLLLLQRSDCLL